MHLLERVEIEPGLGLQPAVEELADLEEFVDRAFDLVLATTLGQRVDDQRVELRVLRLLHPMMLAAGS